MKLPPFLISILTLFARPLGSVVNNALTAASVAFVTWSTAHGVEAGTASTIAAGLVGAVSAAIQWLASTQGVNIAVINADPSNGARVVDAADAKAAGIPKLDPASPKA